jgi:adenosine deaminase
MTWPNIPEGSPFYPFDGETQCLPQSAISTNKTAISTNKILQNGELNGKKIINITKTNQFDKSRRKTSTVTVFAWNVLVIKQDLLNQMLLDFSNFDWTSQKTQIATQKLEVKGACNSQEELCRSLFFESIKREKPKIIQFLLKFPKCDLHNHLSPDYEGNFDYAKEQNLYYDPINKTFHPELKEGSLPAKDFSLNSHANIYADYCKTVTLNGLKADHPIDTCTHFFKTFHTICSTNMPLERMLANECRQAEMENVFYLELMVDLKKIEPIVISGFSLDQMNAFFQQIEEWIDRYCKYWINKINQVGEAARSTLNWNHPFFSTQNPVICRLLVEVMRTPSENCEDPNELLATFFVDIAAAMALSKKDPKRVVGLNIVGPEFNPDARKLFNEQMEILDFLYQKFDQPNIALHAGELTTKVASLSDMMHRISLSITKGHAKRIGHGTCIDYAENGSQLLQKMKENNILVEICPSASKKILGIKMTEHPVQRYRRAGVPYTIATDNPQIFRTSSVAEIWKYIKAVGPFYREVKELSRNALIYSFLEGNGIYVENEDGSRIVHSDYLSLIKNNTYSDELFQLSEKEQAQIILERRLVEFENNAFS